MLGTLIQPGSSHLSYHSEVGFPTTRQGGPRAELGVPGLTFSSVALNLLITPLPQRPRIHMIMQGFPGNLCPQLETPHPLPRSVSLRSGATHGITQSQEEWLKAKGMVGPLAQGRKDSCITAGTGSKPPSPSRG